ncbi:MAG: hypothetical protein JW993_05330 [Sedimentisphaerales bacterium]|nr:hypothetical protein [Sedimentisphaerales bacterium]
MVKLMAGAALSACVTVAFAGCASPGPPQPPREVSAVLPKNAPLSGEDPEACAAADTLVVAQCTRLEEYDSAVKGHRLVSWHATEWHLIRVEQGEWPDETVRFVYRESWPERELGVVYRGTPVAYYPGAVMAFCIERTAPKATIVAQQPRSRVPSYGTLSRPQYDPRDPESVQVFQRVLDAARRYAARTLGGGSLNVTEEYDTFFVVEVRSEDRSVALKVDKGSYRVTRVPDAYSTEELLDPQNRQ